MPGLAVEDQPHPALAHCLPDCFVVHGHATDPHLAADRVTVTVYVAGANDHRSFTAEQAELLESTLTDAGVDHNVEFYPAPTDSPCPKINWRGILRGRMVLASARLSLSQLV